MNSRLKTFLLWMIIIIGFLLVARTMKERKTVEILTLTKLLEYGDMGKVAGGEGENTIIVKLVDQDGSLRGEYIYPPGGKEQIFKTDYNVIGGQGRDILEWARKNKISYTTERRNEFLYSFLPQILLMVVLFGLLWLFLARQFQSGSNKAMSFGKSRAKLHTEGQVKVSFEDVAGVDEVKEELQEIIQFLKDPDKYSRLGGKIPKGALLYGPPGTGKTLIARATACEASVPFFSISGSDFVEMFVGVGASRVRDLFEQGKKAKPCIIYIDEIDAVGRSRFSGMGGGHDEREQTLNALLVELDGFAPNEGVIVMASTNRPDVLDQALLRPGRFDRQIRVDLADMVGREKILEVHTKDLKMGEAISLREIARGTPGFSGADLANLANEAALLAARNDKKSVGMIELEEAKDRVMMGPARRSLAMSEKERTHTAYHEIGHALVAKLADSDVHRVHKVTIIPRGRSLGVTAVLPEEDMHSQNSKQLVDTLLYMMGGRAAEEIKFDDTSTGAANDLHRATELAHKMVCEFGMSETLGPRTFGSASGPLFIGRDMVRERDFSEETARLIDLEVQKLINNAYAEAKNMLTSHLDEFERVSMALLERETLTGAELDELIAGKELPPLFQKGDSDDKHSDNADPLPDEGEPEKGALPTPPPLLDPPSVQPS